MSSRRRRLWLVLLVIVVLMALSDPPPERTGASGTTLIWVTGRIVDAQSGAPIAGAVVIASPARRRVDIFEWEARRERWKELRGDAPMPWPLDMTSADGTFTLSLGIRWSYTVVDGVQRGTDGPPPREGVSALRVEAPDREPRTLAIEVGAGDWQDSANERTTWDLGTLPLD